MKSPAPASILKQAARTTSPTEQLAEMVKDSMNLKSPPTKKKAASSKKKVGNLQVFFPNILYVWKDETRNRMLTLEVHLPSATSTEELEFHLLESADGGPQTLAIKYEYSELFLCNQIFEDNCELEDKNLPVHSMSRLAARRDHLLSFRENFANLEKNTNTVQATQEFVLPFRVENLFNIPIGRKAYTGTGTEFRSYPLTEQVDGDEVQTQMNVLLITLVDEMMLANQVKQNTPSKARKAKSVQRKK